mmetsp:Transcript_115201/g.204192  ORF Transcript_115201/g.204192 Transcript_115201/m.204192 type:complete len:91 (-) Transcript_115201:1410-1682(-)
MLHAGANQRRAVEIGAQGRQMHLEKSKNALTYTLCAALKETLYNKIPVHMHAEIVSVRKQHVYHWLHLFRCTLYDKPLDDPAAITMLSNR